MYYGVGGGRGGYYLYVHFGICKLIKHSRPYKLSSMTGVRSDASNAQMLFVYVSCVCTYVRWRVIFNIRIRIYFRSKRSNNQMERE